MKVYIAFSEALLIIPTSYQLPSSAQLQKASLQTQLSAVRLKESFLTGHRAEKNL